MPSRTRSGTDQRLRGRPRNEYLPPRKEQELLSRVWELIWLYVGEKVVGMPSDRTALRGAASQGVDLWLAPTGEAPPKGPSWLKQRNVPVGAPARERRQTLRELFSKVPTSASVAELRVVPAAEGFGSGDGWRSGPILLRGSGRGARPSAVRARAEREIVKVAGRKPRFDPSQGPIRLAVFLLRRGYGGLSKLTIGQCAQAVYDLVAPLAKGDEDRSEWRAVVRHYAGARRQAAAAGRRRLPAERPPRTRLSARSRGRP